MAFRDISCWIFLSFSLRKTLLRIYVIMHFSVPPTRKSSMEEGALLTAVFSLPRKGLMYGSYPGPLHWVMNEKKSINHVHLVKVWSQVEYGRWMELLVTVNGYTLTAFSVNSLVSVWDFIFLSFILTGRWSCGHRGIFSPVKWSVPKDSVTFSGVPFKISLCLSLPLLLLFLTPSPTLGSTWKKVDVLIRRDGPAQEELSFPGIILG